MKKYNTTELAEFLLKIVASSNYTPLFIWSPPGVGKSATVKAVAETKGMPLTDLRLSQLMPSDLRGLPMNIDGEMRFSRPTFLPKGDQPAVLFLDEINMAPPAQMGNAQQLILDRRVGDHVLGAGTFIWAACNRREDRASVSEMPAPVANRGIHIQLVVDIKAFNAYAMQHPKRIHEDVLGFLNFRTNLLHAYEPGAIAFPSPRSWEYASRLIELEETVEAAVGEGPARELQAYIKLKREMPNIGKVLSGKRSIPFPSEPSLQYSTVFALIHQAMDSESMVHAFRWLLQTADPEWVSLFTKHVFPKMDALGLKGRLVQAMKEEPRILEFAKSFQAYLRESSMKSA